MKNSIYFTVHLKHYVLNLHLTELLRMKSSDNEIRPHIRLLPAIFKYATRSSRVLEKKLFLVYTLFMNKQYICFQLNGSTYEMAQTDLHVFIIKTYSQILLYIFFQCKFPTRWIV